MITRIEVLDHRVIREARCDAVPPVMLICGPNGVGKTTALDAIGREQGVTKDGPTEVIVAPVVRTWRKEPMQARMLQGNQATSTQAFSLLVALRGMAQSFGRTTHSEQRDLWSDDDSKQFVKPLLAKLRNQWKDYLEQEVTRAEGHTPERDWPMARTALATFTEGMFDELTYVDTVEAPDVLYSTGYTNTNILFRSVNLPGTDIDIDDLSSGEKAIFSIFLPLIEEEVNRQLGKEPRQLTLLIDELEAHLHPSMQLHVLHYMRAKAGDGYQFICTTHSTTLIKACAQDELFHVLPKGMTVGNQLRKAASETQELVEVIQESVLFANGYQRYIYCEGFDLEKPDEHNICDSELYTELLNLSQRERLFAADSAAVVHASARAASSAVFPTLCLASIVDHDGSRMADPRSAWCEVVLPLYSLESLLLNPDAIVPVIAVYGIGREAIEHAVARAIDRAISDRESQIFTPGSSLRTRQGIQYVAGLAHLQQGDIAALFELRSDAVERLQKVREQIDAARQDRQVAIRTLKGKKIYHYLFEELNLGGKRFSHRSFAMDVARNARRLTTYPWLPDFERVVKHGVGNALGALLLGPEGQPIRDDPQYGAAFATVRDLIEPIRLGTTDYAVIRDGVRIESFAQQLAPLATAARDRLPGYPAFG